MQTKWNEQEPLSEAKDTKNAEEIIPEPGTAEFSGGEENLCPEDQPTPETGKDPASEVRVLEDEKRVLVDRLSRLQADFDNYRKRVEKEKLELADYANAEIFSNFLPILDNFERALASGQTESDGFAKGVEMIYRQFITFLEKQGVTMIEAEGAIFDPHLHHAVFKEAGPEGVAEDTIIEVLQKGYLMKDRVLRPAMVKVAE